MREERARPSASRWVGTPTISTGDRPLADQLPDHGELLIILLAEDRDIGADLRRTGGRRSVATPSKWPGRDRAVQASGGRARPDRRSRARPDTWSRRPAPRGWRPRPHRAERRRSPRAADRRRGPRPRRTGSGSRRSRRRHGRPAASPPRPAPDGRRAARPWSGTNAIVPPSALRASISRCSASASRMICTASRAPIEDLGKAGPSGSPPT